jgi:carbonic anhydrase/acetyltransferase-like protein (isoleucine patch superfamily)
VCVLKGVTIGKNTVVGARSVVVSDLPGHCVAAGNPARVIKELDPNASYYSRSDVMADQSYLDRLYELESYLTKENTLLGFLRYLLLPRRGD